MKKTYLPKPHGFTIVELLVVIVIVGLLSIMGFMSGRKNLKRAALAEGESFIEEIVTKERLYRANSGEFLNINKQYNSDTLQINGRKNKYFNKFSVFDCDNRTGFKVAVFGGSGISNNTSKNEVELSMKGISITAKYNAQTNDFDLIDGDQFKVNGLQYE